MKKLNSEVVRVLMMLAGNLLDAAGFTLFVIPAGLITGGVSGLGLFVHNMTNLSVSMTVLAINLIMFIIGFFLLGKKFAASTALSTFFYPAALWIIEKLANGHVVTHDIVLNTVFGGIFIGAGVALLLRAGASSGGMDIPPLILRKYFRMPLSITIYILDLIILLLQAYNNKVQIILYGIILVLIYSVVIDKLMIIGTNMMQLKIVSAKNEEIKEMIFEEIDRGVTYLKGRSGYLAEDTDILLSVISNRELAKIEKRIHKIDPGAFIIINKVTEVKGRGFSLDKDHEF